VKRKRVLIVALVISLLVLAGASGCTAEGELTEEEVILIQKFGLVVIEVGLPVLLAWGLAMWKQQLQRARQWQDWYKVEQAVHRAVKAAEQLGLTEDLTQYGEGKLDAAIRFVEAQLAAQGVPLDVDEHADAIRSMIEAAVKEQFPKGED
jgi:hypothetical protein